MGGMTTPLALCICVSQPIALTSCLLRSGTDLYNEVKRAGDSFLGIPTQCFVTRKASIGVPQVPFYPR
jgi:hypothetical protein